MGVTGTPKVDAGGSRLTIEADGVRISLPAPSLGTEGDTLRVRLPLPGAPRGRRRRIPFAVD